MAKATEREKKTDTKQKCATPDYIIYNDSVLKRSSQGRGKGGVTLNNNVTVEMCCKKTTTTQEFWKEKMKEECWMLDAQTYQTKDTEHLTSRIEVK